MIDNSAADVPRTPSTGSRTPRTGNMYARNTGQPSLTVRTSEGGYLDDGATGPSNSHGHVSPFVLKLLTKSPGKLGTPGNNKWSKAVRGVGSGSPGKSPSQSPSPGGKLHSSWSSVLRPNSARRGVFSRGASIKDILEATDRDEEERLKAEYAETRRIAQIMEGAMRRATAAAAKQVENRMWELSLKERHLAEQEKQLAEREARLPAEVLDEAGDHSHMTAISFSELNALRLKLHEFDRQEELRQRLLAQKRLDDRSSAEEQQNRRYMRASEKIMANWRSSSCRKCLMAWAEGCVNGRKNKAKIHRVLVRLTLRVRATAFARWTTHAKTAAIDAERKALEEAAERKFRTRMYSNFSDIQSRLMGDQMDEDSLMEKVKEKDHKIQELREQIEDLRASEEALQATVAAMKEEMETNQHVWDVEKGELMAAVRREAATTADAWKEKVEAVEGQRKASLEKARKVSSDLEQNLRDATEKCAEWEAMYNELNSIMNQSVANTPKDRGGHGDGVQMV